jgi:hypothetical protein
LLKTHDIAVSAVAPGFFASASTEKALGIGFAQVIGMALASLAALKVVLDTKVRFVVPLERYLPEFTIDYFYWRVTFQEISVSNCAWYRCSGAFRPATRLEG